MKAPRIGTMVLCASVLAAIGASSQEAIHQFDFGTPTSVTRKGFTKVTVADAFAAGRGYGFESVDGLRASDRGGWEKKPPESERSARVYGAWRSTSFTTCDFVEDSTPNAFVVSVPDGEYEVWAVVADALQAPPLFEIRANDETKADVRVPRARFVYIEPFRARATSGTLRIEFTGDHGWLLNALLIGRPGPAVTAAAAGLERAIFFETDADLKNWNEVKRASPNPAPELSDAERRAGYVTFVRDYTRPIYPSSIPTRPEIETPLRAFACPDEFEPASFAIYPQRDLGAVDVEVGDFSSGDGSRISAANVEVGLVRCWRQRVGSTRGASGDYMVVPEIIDPPGGRRRVTLAGTTKQWWLTVHVPEDATPGRYRGTVRIRPEKAPASEVEWRLLVLPIELVRPKDRHWGTWLDGFPPLGRLNGPASRGRNTPEERKRIATAEMIDFRNHGFDTAILPASGIRVTEEPDGSFSYDLGSISKQLEYLKLLDSTSAVTLMLEYLCRNIEYRFANDDPHVAGTFSPKARRAFVGLVRFIDAERRRHDWPTIYYYPIDEPGNSKTDNRYAFAENVLDMVHEVPGCQTNVTVTADCVRRLGEQRIDVRLYAYGHYSRDKVLADTRRGFPFWYYANGMFYAESVVSSRGMSGLEFLRSGATCATAWGFSAVYANPHNDFDAGHEDWNTVFPGLDKPTPTIYWELCREGFDDCRYVATLEQTIARAREAGNASQADRAQRILDPLIDMDSPRVRNPELFHRLRWRMAREILRLGGSRLVQPLPFVAVAASAVTGDAFEPNLVANPSFEAPSQADGLPGWPYPFNDPFVSDQKKPVGAVMVSDDVAHSGTHSLKWDVGKAQYAGGSTFGSHRYLVINVQIDKQRALELRGKRVKVGMWVRIGGGLVSPGMNLRQYKDGEFLSNIPFQGGVADPTTWNLYEAEGRLRSDIDGLDIHTFCRIPEDPKASEGAVFYTDDFYLQAYKENPVSVATPLEEYYVGETVPWTVAIRAPAAQVAVSLLSGRSVARRQTLSGADPNLELAGSFATVGLTPGVYTLRATVPTAGDAPATEDWRRIIVAPDPFAAGSPWTARKGK